MVLGVAVSVAAQHIGNLNLPEMAKVDGLMFNIMGYDFVWGDTGITSHASNLLPTSQHPYSGHTGVQAYLVSIKPGRINLGIPLYGKVFPNAVGLGDLFWGKPPPNVPTEATNVIHGPDLKHRLQNQAMKWDSAASASYVIDKENFVISYDSREAIDAKANYIQKQGLGGAMFWSTWDDSQGLIACCACELGICT